MMVSDTIVCITIASSDPPMTTPIKPHPLSHTVGFVAKWIVCFDFLRLLTLTVDLGMELLRALTVDLGMELLRALTVAHLRRYGDPVPLLSMTVALGGSYAEHDCYLGMELPQSPILHVD